MIQKTSRKLSPFKLPNGKINLGEQIWTYKYDHRNRLISAHQQFQKGVPSRDRTPRLGGPPPEVDRLPGFWTNIITNYVYDAMGNRLEQNLQGFEGKDIGKTHFVNDGREVIADLDDSQGKNTVEAYYLRGDQTDQLFGRVDRDSQATSNSHTVWNIVDRQNSVRFLVDGTDATMTSTRIPLRIDYEAFGKPIPIPPKGAAVALGRYGYTGRELDKGTDLLYNRARYYDPTIGRWISQDPLGLAPDPNPYRYAGNSPTNFTDPSGMAINLGFAAAGMVIGGIVGGIQSGWTYEGIVRGAAVGGLAGLTLGISLAYAPAAYGVGTLAAGAAVAATHGAVESYLTGGSPGEILFAGTMGLASGLMNPWGAFASAGGALLGFGVGWARTKTFEGALRFAQVGGLIGGLAQPFGAAYRSAAKEGWRAAMLAGTMGVAPEVLGAGVGVITAARLGIDPLTGAQIGLFGAGLIRLGAAGVRAGRDMVRRGKVSHAEMEATGTKLRDAEGHSYFRDKHGNLWLCSDQCTRIGSSGKLPAHQKVARDRILEEHPGLHPDVATKAVRSSLSAGGKGAPGGDIILVSGGRREVSVHAGSIENLGGHIAKEAGQEGTRQVWVQVNTLGATRTQVIQTMQGKNIGTTHPVLINKQVVIFGSDGTQWWSGTIKK